MEELLFALLSKTLNMETEQVAELVKTDDGKSIKDDALDQLLALDADRVTELKGKGGDDTKAFDNGYKKAQGEILTKQEEEIKKHYEITSELKGLDLIGEIVTRKTKALEDKEVTPDEIKKSPTYQTAIANINSVHEQKIEEITQKHQDEIEGFKKKESMVGVIQAADTIIDSLNPIWSKDAGRALSQRKKIHEGIQNGNFKLNPEGMPIVLNSEGKALEDKHGNPVPFKSFVTNEVTSLLDLQAVKPRDGGGDIEDDGGAGLEDGWNWDGVKPADDKAFIEAVKKANSTEEKVAIQKSYKGES